MPRVDSSLFIANALLDNGVNDKSRSISATKRYYRSQCPWKLNMSQM